MVANAVLTPKQMQLVNDGEIIEVRIEVKDISGTVIGRDKEVIEKGFAEYQNEIPELTLGIYVDISMFIRLGEGGGMSLLPQRNQSRSSSGFRRTAESFISSVLMKGNISFCTMWTIIRTPS